MDNNSLQEEEQEVLISIYADQWKREIDGEKSFSIDILDDVKLYITLNSSYPSEAPPTYQLLAPCLSRQKKDEIEQAFNSIYLDNLGEPVLFQWIEKLKELVQNDVNDKNIDNEELQTKRDYADLPTKVVENIPKHNIQITHGSTIVDRKSTFQGHVCTVHSLEEINMALSILHENKKIAQATHNIQAYIIKQPNGIMLQDCDDDGETHAGGRLLHLLQILKVENVFVVVSRWFGGIHLGPDRFRHINNAARQVLVESGHIKKE